MRDNVMIKIIRNNKKRPIVYKCDGNCGKAIGSQGYLLIISSHFYSCSLRVCKKMFQKIFKD